MAITKRRRKKEQMFTSMWRNCHPYELLVGMYHGAALWETV